MIFQEPPNELENPQSPANAKLRPAEFDVDIYRVKFAGQDPIESVGVRSRGRAPVVQQIWSFLEKAGIEADTAATPESLAEFIEKAAKLAKREREFVDSRDTRGLDQLLRELNALEKKCYNKVWGIKAE